MQANVGRGRISHNLALQLAQENNADVVLIQEPWTYRDLTSKQSVAHHNYDTFSHLSTWDTRPRVLTYIRKSREYRPFQSTIDSSFDMLKITITNRSNQNSNIWNVYNVPTNSINTGAGLQALLNSSKSDTLDLAFCSQLGATYTIRSDLHTISDHETLLSLVPCDRNGILSCKGRFRYDSRDERLSLSLLGDSQDIPHILTPADVDDEANNNTQIHQTALAASCTRKKGRNLGIAWWNDEWRADEERSQLRTAARHAKKELASDSERPPSVYAIRSWKGMPLGKGCGEFSDTFNTAELAH
ncbi:hypothetical protein EPUL_004067 [Erysiphe pulchra]|uniref:Endonuclease/exonuclease/phosphatase domain-containing protein n=1 Tax=Erysiphe pulchra TaxID=225359 RepID=A0A2S4PKV3_9PEZI|nr:hypothetical protein EPUL_004067 [Erysiphe pulchra]